MAYSLHVIVWFLVAISILVAVHEYGHFIVARMCQVKVLRFSIGFGPRLFKLTDRHGTEFALSAIPLGGYVKMLDEGEGDVETSDLHLAFNRKKPWQKILIALAGPFANFVLAVALYFAYALFVGDPQRVPVVGDVQQGSIAQAMGLERGQQIVAIDGQPVESSQDVLLSLVSRLGESGDLTMTVKYPQSDLRYQINGQLDEWLRGLDTPDPIAGLGFSFQDYKPLIVGVAPDSPASRAGFLVDDVVLSSNGELMHGASQWVEFVKARPGEIIDVVVLRGDQTTALQVMPKLETLDDGSEVARVGVSLGYNWSDYFVMREFGLFGALSKGFEDTWGNIKLVLVSFKKVIFGEISIKNLSGPVGIAKVAGDSAIAGFWVFISFLALISVSLGVMNLLPIPVLDGGHVVYSAIEWIKGSAVSKTVQTMGYQVGLAMILCLTIVVIYNDIARLVNPAQ